MNVELILDNFWNRGMIVPVGAIGSAFYLQNYKREAWRSYFMFGDSVIEYMKENTSMNNSYPGDIYMDKIYLDYEVIGEDEGGDKIVEEVRGIVTHMQHNLDVPSSHIRIWFSGRRGFHVELPDLFGIEPSPNLPETLRASVVGMLNHPCLDDKCIFTSGILRLPWSRHSKTGLHKIPLLITELYKLDFKEIQHLASDPMVTRKGFAFPPIDDPDPIWRKEIVQKKKSFNFGSANKGLTLRYDPTRVVTCMQKLQDRGPQKGRRHTDILRLVTWLRKTGIPEDWVVSSIMDWLAGHLHPEEVDKTEEFIRRTYAKEYNYSCKDSVMSEYCDKKCVYFKKKNYTMNVDTPESLAESFKEFIKKLRSNDAGIEFSKVWPKFRGRYKPVPGDIVMITGDTGMAKTMLVQNIIISLRQETLWLNLEMTDHLNFRRFIQIDNSMTKDQVEEFFISRSDEEINALNDRIRFIKQVSISPTLSQIEQMITQYDPQIVVVDTTDEIEIIGSGSGSTSHLRKVMEGLRAITQRYGCIIIAIHHITKSASKETTEGTLIGGGKREVRKLTLNDLTGDRSNVTKVDHVFAVEGEQGSNIRILRSLKVRDGEPITLRFFVDWETFRWHHQP